MNNHSNNINNDSNNFDDKLDLLEFSQVLIKGKWVIFSVTSFVSILTVIFSLLIPNIYESKALLAPVNSSGISGAMQSYSGLAGIAGISLPSVAAESNSKKAINTMTSLSFFENNIMPNIFIPNLIAIKSWNHEQNKITYKENIYDENLNIWVRDYSFPYKQIPSAQESFEVFKNKHLNITEETKTGFITITVRHQSPFIAREWTDLIINEVNNFYRQKDKSEAQKAASYLYEQIEITNLSEIKQVIAELLKQETQKLTLIEVTPYYVFDYIDPPAVMEKKVGPKRAVICILGAFLGGMLSIVFVLLNNYRPWKKILSTKELF